VDKCLTYLARLLACAPALAMPAHGQPLALEEAIGLGEAQSPRLAAQRSAISATSEQIGRAGALPDPKLKLGIENLPVTGPDRFRYDRDFMTARAIGYVQEFPNSAKREARNLRAERMRDVETANLHAQRVLVRRDVALAWLDAHYAERAGETLERLRGQFRLQLDALPSGIARGRQTVTDSYVLRQAFEQTNDRIIEQERLAARAKVALAALLGDEAMRPLAAAPDTSKLVHRREHLIGQLAEHPQIRAINERENLARAEVQVARSTAKSDWMLEVGYGHRGPAFDNMLSVMVSFDVPWDTARRQDRDIASRLAEVDQARAMREEARRMHEADLRGWLADFDAAQRRIRRLEEILLPLARDRRAAALAAYEGGRGELSAVLEAERSRTDAELGLLQALADRGKAWAQLNYLYAPGDAR
jgi:outer membrane protein, heavy metal efflux system